ncbi:mitogen-activated protein kinase kinase kinase NPK1-like [Magnolia sinica]|uniref:mitogen-activated protein kinase kinase kinase NPK1-like n=1 Tax=Magnolia sinica TaxID=86752 RepID=UPI00265B6B45|nr:mitogen-activated protein kinase kinase kinase NPK1-like [Magnolia sinica]
MHGIMDSLRRSLVFTVSGGADEGSGSGGLVDKIIKKSRAGFVPKTQKENNTPPIRWRKGELIGCGAFGRVYMGMNLDCGELLAVKQVLIANNASKEKAQDHIQELEEEVKLLKNLSHPNIVRYLGTAREEDTLNILLEFVPGGSISSLLGKFGSFPEPVVRMYTKQLLQGLEYLHMNGIMHRDIKGANILVDNKGCIKLADFGASKQVAELATISGAKSMKGTPYWMAPEVILQTGHSFSADIWSVGCTVIEMATGKPPWSQQYKEVAALFYIGTTKSHPPIPEHLSLEAKDFLLKCLQDEPSLRPSASELLQHPFVTGEYKDPHPIFRSSSLEHSAHKLPSSGSELENLPKPLTSSMTNCEALNGICDNSAVYQEKFPSVPPIWETSGSEDMCQVDDDFSVGGSVRPASALMFDPFKSFNPMSEPIDDSPCEFDGILEQRRIDLEGSSELVNGTDSSFGASGKLENDFTFPSGPPVSEDDDEVTESKIRAFLDEKALDLKKLQTPLYEFYNTLNVANPSPSPVAGKVYDETNPKILKLPPKSRSPGRVASGPSTPPINAVNTASPGSGSRRVSSSGGVNNQSTRELPSPQRNEWRELLVDSEQEPSSPSVSFAERQKKWKEELDRELERKREMMRQAGVGGKTSSPKDRALSRQRERSQFASPGK